MSLNLILCKNYLYDELCSQEIVKNISFLFEI